MSIPLAPPPPSTPGKMSCCLRSVIGIGISTGVVIVAFFILLGRTGWYQPNIPPSVPLPNPNAFDDYVAAGALFKNRGGTKSLEPLQEAYRKALYISSGNLAPEPVIGPLRRNLLSAERILVKRNEDVLARMRRGFSKKCRMPEVRSINTLLPYLAEFRDMARLLAAASHVAKEDGDHRKAFELSLDSLHLGYDTMQGGPLINGLVGIAIQAIAWRGLVENLDYLSLSDCKALLPRLIEVTHSCATTSAIFAEERITSLASLKEIEDAIMSGDRAKIAELSVGDEEDADAFESAESMKKMATLPGQIYWRFLRDQGFQEIDDINKAAIREAGKAVRQRTKIPQPRSLLASLMIPEYNVGLSKFDISETRRRLLVCAVSIRQQMLATGRLPKSLNDLPIEKEFTLDPFTGELLIYRPNGRSFLLYSVGPDFKDDGGMPANEKDEVLRGDLGVQRFSFDLVKRPPDSNYYKAVPYMLPPVFPSGAPALMH